MENKTPETNSNRKELKIVKKQILPINSVKPYWRNARDNTKTIAILKDSIEKYGFQGAILVDKNMVIITGHARYSALLQMGYKEVPIEVSEMEEKYAKEYRIIDNKIHEATNWRTDELILEVREIGNIDYMQKFFDVDLSNWHKETVGFNVDEVEQEEVDNQVKVFNEQFGDKVDERQELLVKITCPNCLEDMELRRKQIEVYLK